jgi:hypothetical protein
MVFPTFFSVSGGFFVPAKRKGGPLWMSLSPKLTLKGVVRSRRETAGLLKSPGDAILVERGTPRWLLLLCPCGCGAELPINLDSRTGPA